MKISFSRNVIPARLVLLLAALALAGAACQPTPAAISGSDTGAGTATLQPSVTATKTSTPTPTVTGTASPTATQTPSPTATPTATVTPTVTITPTYAVLRGRVLQLSNCRYGPGAPYLYKYALIEGSNLDVIGRRADGSWVLVQAIGGSNPCWVKASLMDIQGDVFSVAPVEIPLPMSPYYGPLTTYSAQREGDTVTVFWQGIQLRAGDDSGQYPYLLEAWVCQDGELVFVPIGTYDYAVEVTDEAGCQAESHARLYAVEKHGYTRPVEIPWPEHDAGG